MSTPDITIDTLLKPGGSNCLIIRAEFAPLGDQDRFQPAGFPEMGHVLYDAPRSDENGNPGAPEKVCIVDSAASMANHLETLCFANAAAGILHDDLAGLAYVRCVTDGKKSSDAKKRRLVVSTLTEGHRLASDYFLDAKLDGKNFREQLRSEFGITEIKKDKTYFITPDDWWDIYTTVFKYDPNSLVHGILFAKEQIKISRLLTAHLEAFGAARVGSSGVKFDRLGKTNSGQPIFARDEETAHAIRATFLIDLGLLRSYGHGDKGLGEAQKNVLLHLALWKIEQMLASPFRFRSGCHLKCTSRSYSTEGNDAPAGVEIKSSIKTALQNAPGAVTDVYYAANTLFKAEAATDATAGTQPAAEDQTDEDEDQE